MMLRGDSVARLVSSVTVTSAPPTTRLVVSTTADHTPTGSLSGLMATGGRVPTVTLTALGDVSANTTARTGLSGRSLHTVYAYGFVSPPRRERLTGAVTITSGHAALTPVARYTKARWSTTPTPMLSVVF